MRRHVDMMFVLNASFEWNGSEEQEGACPDADWWLVGSFIFGSEPWMIDLANWAPAIDRSWTALLCRASGRENPAGGSVEVQICRVV
jgi:hypothetical protein